MIWFTCHMTIIQPILGQQSPLTMHKKWSSLKKKKIKDLVSKCRQILGKLMIWSHSLEISIMANFIFNTAWSVYYITLVIIELFCIMFPPYWIDIAPFQFSYWISLLFPSDQIFFGTIFITERGRKYSNFERGMRRIE